MFASQIRRWWVDAPVLHWWLTRQMDSLKATDKQDIEQTDEIVDCMEPPESHALQDLLPSKAISCLQLSKSVIQHR